MKEYKKYSVISCLHNIRYTDACVESDLFDERKQNHLIAKRIIFIEY